MKQVEVLVYRRVYTTYYVEVPDGASDSEINRHVHRHWDDYGAEGWVLSREEVDTEEIDVIHV